MNSKHVLLAMCVFALLTTDRAAGQRRVDDRNFGERLIYIAPIVGDGSTRNPFRPLFAPQLEDIRPGGFIGYTAVLSDDKKLALVEVVAYDRKAFDTILKDTRPDVTKFDPARGARKEQIEAEFRKYKKDFDFAKFKEGK